MVLHLEVLQKCAETVNCEKRVPCRRKYCEAKYNYFGINFQIANANLWVGSLIMFATVIAISNSCCFGL